MTKLQKLVLEWADTLNQQAYEAHQEYGKWHPEPLSEMDKTKLSIKIQNCHERIHEIIDGLLEEESVD